MKIEHIMIFSIPIIVVIVVGLGAIQMTQTEFQPPTRESGSTLVWSGSDVICGKGTFQNEIDNECQLETKENLIAYGEQQKNQYKLEEFKQSCSFLNGNYIKPTMTLNDRCILPNGKVIYNEE